MHALYGYFYLGLSKTQLATIYNKHINTISNWIQRFESDNDYQRRSTKQKGQFTEEQRAWLLDFYTIHPVAFLDEAKAAFEQKLQSLHFYLNGVEDAAAEWAHVEGT